MCGIAGIVDFTNGLHPQTLRETLSSMSREIAHRGPDDQGMWCSECNRLGFAHRRLSIIDLTSAGHQPMESHDAQLVITFNGEIYNYKELRETLSRAGAQFTSNSDTEVLLEAYRKYGEDCLERLDGMYSFVIYDKRKDEIFAARDPFGEKPFYYSLKGERFIFASELKSLSQLPDLNKSTDLTTVSKFLCLQYVEGDTTLYPDIKKLKPGHYLRLKSDNSSTIKRFFEFTPLMDNGRQVNEDDLVDELEEILTLNLSRRLRADVPVGAFLSGGIDSSLVVAIARKKLGVDIQTFTIGFDGWDGSEHLDARMTAEFLGSVHREKLLTPECYKLLDHLVEIIDEPNADTSILPTFLISEFARKHVKVVLSGDGADELFAGYGRYFSTLSEEKQLKFDAGKAYYSNKILTFNEFEIDPIMRKVPYETWQFLKELRSTISQSPLELINRLRKTDIENYLPGAVLSKVDRMSMRHGLEVRTPFLSINMARFAEKIPPKYLANQSTGKLLLKKLAERYLPAELLDKPKKGFGVPFTSWGEDVILEKATKKLLKRDAIRQWWLNVDGVRPWIEFSKKHNATEIYKLWSIYHLDRYIEKNNVTPIDKTNPFYIWLLKQKLKNHKQETIVFSVLPLDFNSQCRDEKIFNISAWQGPPEAFEYKEESDWIANFESVFEKYCSDFHSTPKTVVFLDGYIKDLYLNAQYLRSRGVQTAIVYEEGIWKKIPIKVNGKFQEELAKITPAFFSAQEKTFVKRNNGELFKDFKYFFRSTFRPQSFAVHEDVFLLEEKRYFFDRKTPLRAYALLKEVVDAIQYKYNEAIFYQKLRSSLSKGYRAPQSISNKIIFILPSLYSGGAERQACNLMSCLKQRGYDIQLIVLSSLVGSGGHYLPLVEKAGVNIIDIDAENCGQKFSEIEDIVPNSTLELLSHSSDLIQKHIWPVFYRLFLEKPANVICMLDSPNVIGGVAATLAGVPKVITSFRNINPTSFFFHEEWFLPFYRALITSPNVTFTGNSIGGNKSYAKWLGIDIESIKLLRNGVDFSSFSASDNEAITKLKSELGIAPEDKTIVGIFRFSEEKKPEVFVQVINEMVQKLPSIKAVLVGEGPLKTKIEKMIKSKGLHNNISLIGSVDNVEPYISMSDIILQTSRAEGTANSLLEAQYLQKPVVATSGGGVAESLNHGETGWVVDSDDPGQIARFLLDKLADPEMLRKTGQKGREFVIENYNLERATDKLIEYCGLKAESMY